MKKSHFTVVIFIMQMNRHQIFQLSLFVMAFKPLKLWDTFDDGNSRMGTQFFSNLFQFDNCDIQATDVNDFQNVFWYGLLYWRGMDLSMWLFHALSWNLRLEQLFCMYRSSVFLLPLQYEY